MSDTVETAATEPSEPNSAPAQEAAPEAPAQEPDWKAEARKWEQRAKQNSEAAKRLAEIEEASKTEAEKQAEELEKLRAQVKQYETERQIAEWKSEVSQQTGVPADVLRGSTLEELKAHAETLKSLIDQKPAGPQPIPGEGRPVATPLNGDGIESALKNALGIN